MKILKSLCRKYLASEITELISQIDSSQDKISHLEAFVSSLSNSLKDSLEKTRENNNVISEQKSKIAILQSHINSLSKEKVQACKDLEASNASLSSEVLELKKTQRSLKAKVTRLENLLEQRECALHISEKKLRETINKNDAAEQSLHMKDLSIAELNSILNEKTGIIDNLIAKRQMDAKKSELYASRIIKSILKIREEIQKNLKLKTELEKQITESRSINEINLKQETALNLLSDNFESLKKSAETKDLIIEDLKLTVASNKEELENSIIDCQELNETIARITEKLEIARKEQFETKQLNSELLDTINVLRLENQRLKKAEQDLLIAKNHISELEKRPNIETVNRLRDENNELKTQLESQKKTGRSSHRSVIIVPPNHLDENQIIEAQDFPEIRNENLYSLTTRKIDIVYDCRFNNYIEADTFFKESSPEQISNLGIELIEAKRINKPYLVCPHCGEMVKISSRRIGIGSTCREIQFFIHATKNTPCDLKRDYVDNTYYSNETTSFQDNGISYLKEIRSLIQTSLESPNSIKKGIGNVKAVTGLKSDIVPDFKNRIVDICAEFKQYKIAFELVTPSTSLQKVYDRDIFYLINGYKVFWLFGLQSDVNYNELRRSVAKDILFFNKRNVFVFDLEARNASIEKGELLLKCNWLDKDDKWHYRKEINNMNGRLVSIDEITFDEDSCRPYLFDADSPYFELHPHAKKPQLKNRQQLIEDMLRVAEYESCKSEAIKEMVKNGSSIESFFNGEKWGFKYKDIVFIEPCFNTKPILGDFFAKVEKDGKFRAVNRFGSFTIEPECDELEILRNNKILYSRNKEWYIIDINHPIAQYNPTDSVTSEVISDDGNFFRITINKNYDSREYTEDIYCIAGSILKKDNSTGKWILWDENSLVPNKNVWDSVELLNNKTLQLTISGVQQIISVENGNIQFFDFKKKTCLVNEGAIVETLNNKWGLIDKNGRIVLNAIYDSIQPINNQYLRLCLNQNWGIVDINGNLICEPQYHSIDSFDGEFFTVSISVDDKVGYFPIGRINTSGEKIKEIDSVLENGRCIFSLFGKHGIIYEDQVIIEPLYSEIKHWIGNRYIAKLNGKYGIIDDNNSVILPFEFTSIGSFINGKSKVSKFGKSYHIDSSLKTVSDEVIELKNGFRKIKYEGKWGIVNQNGDLLVDYRYDEISTFRGRLIGVINGRLIKLNCYYPYRLPMKLNIRSSKRNANQVVAEIGGVEFKIHSKEVASNSSSLINAALINWTKNGLPQVALFDPTQELRPTRHYDKPEDFAIGESYEASFDGVLNNRTKTGIRFRGVAISMKNNRKSYIYKSDLRKAGINPADITENTIFRVTKVSYDEDLDRTNWSVELLSK